MLVCLRQRRRPNEQKLMLVEKEPILNLTFLFYEQHIIMKSVMMTSVGGSMTIEALKPSVSILAFSLPAVRIYAFMSLSASLFNRSDLPRGGGYSIIRPKRGGEAR